MVDVLAGIGMGRFLVRVRVSGVDLGEDALCPVERRPRACLFWFGQVRVAEEHAVDVLGVLGPDRAVLGVVGGLRAAGRVTHPDQRLVGIGGVGEFEAERLAGVGEPAVVPDPTCRVAAVALSSRSTRRSSMTVTGPGSWRARSWSTLWNAAMRARAPLPVGRTPRW